MPLSAHCNSSDEILEGCGLWGGGGLREDTRQALKSSTEKKEKKVLGAGNFPIENGQYTRIWKENYRHRGFYSIPSQFRACHTYPRNFSHVRWDKRFESI
jgi:hypothetical protein